MIKSVHEVRDLADQAKAEAESGAVKESGDQRWLDGFEDALRWATGDGVSEETAALLDRRQRSADAQRPARLREMVDAYFAGAYRDEEASQNLEEVMTHLHHVLPG